MKSVFLLSTSFQLKNTSIPLITFSLLPFNSSINGVKSSLGVLRNPPTTGYGA